MDLQQSMNQKQQQSQKLAMTQQLKQAIQILQYNTEELNQFLEAKALENPLIEVQKPEDFEISDFSRQSSSERNEEENQFINQIPDAAISLFEYLREQIFLNYRDTYLRQLILFLLEYIDRNGYLTISLEEAMSLSEAEYVSLLDALTLLQQLDPAGVGARDLRECLMLQTERDDQAPEIAYIVLEEEFQNLVNRKWQEIAKKYQVSLKEIQAVFDYIQTLAPNPGNIFGNIQEQYIVPDLLAEKNNEGWAILPLSRHLPKLVFQEHYFKKFENNSDPEVQSYLKEKKQEFDWLAKTIHQRGSTILKVGQVILEKQYQFFEEADRPLTPLTLREVADEVGVHESTVSRAVNGKYLQTEFGVFELRSFFVTGISLQSGEEMLSSKVIKDKLTEIVAQENKQKPLSDQKIVELLTQAGFPISRRTVAKYRDELGILSSSKRKRFDE